MFGLEQVAGLLVLVLIAVLVYNALRSGKGKRFAEGVDDEMGWLFEKWEARRVVPQLKRAVQKNWNDKVRLQVNFGACGKVIKEFRGLCAAVAEVTSEARVRLIEFEWAVANPHEFAENPSDVDVALAKIEPTKAGIAAYEELQVGIGEVLAVAEELHRQIRNRLAVLETKTQFQAAQVEPFTTLDTTVNDLGTIAASLQDGTTGDEQFTKASKRILQKVERLNTLLETSASPSISGDDSLAKKIQAIREGVSS